MPDIMTDYEHLKTWDSTKLLQRRQDLTGSGDTRQLSDAALIELVAIARILRTRTNAPKLPGSARKATAPTLDVL